MKSFKLVIIVFILAYLVVGWYIYFYQNNFVYFPTKQDFISCSGFKESEKININGTRAYFEKNSDKLIIFYHGNAGSTCNRDYLKNKFKNLGFSTLFVEYTGFSNDTKKPTKELLMNDVLNMDQFLKTVKFNKIIIIGESLGNALAIYHSTLTRVDKLLLISPFYKMEDLARNNFGIYPIKLILRENYDNGQLINKSKANKIRIIHGTDDDIISLDQAKKLFDEIKISDKDLLKIDKAGHNNIYTFEETNKNIDNFLVE
jgi:hypothetical protein